MNITDAAKITTDSITEYLDFYQAADELTDGRVIVAFAETNRDLDTPLHTDDLDILFADYADVMDAQSTLGGYLTRHTEAPAQEGEFAAAVREYVTHLNASLRAAGYEGQDFTDEQFTELIK